MFLIIWPNKNKGYMYPKAIKIEYKKQINFRYKHCLRSFGCVTEDVWGSEYSNRKDIEKLSESFAYYPIWEIYNFKE